MKSGSVSGQTWLWTVSEGGMPCILRIHICYCCAPGQVWSADNCEPLSQARKWPMDCWVLSLGCQICHHSLSFRNKWHTWDCCALVRTKDESGCILGLSIFSTFIISTPFIVYGADLDFKSQMMLQVLRTLLWDFPEENRLTNTEQAVLGENNKYAAFECL